MVALHTVKAKGGGSVITVILHFLETGFHVVQTDHEFLMFLLPPPELLGLQICSTVLHLIW